MKETANPILITGAALLLFTAMFFQLSKEGFTAVPDEKKGGLGCPPNFEWTDESHSNCKRVIDNDSTWYETPVCPEGLVYTLDGCYKEDEALTKENAYHIEAAIVSTVVSAGLIYFIPAVAPWVGLVGVMFITMILIIGGYIRANGTPSFGFLKHKEATYEEYQFQFYMLIWFFATIFLFVGYMIGTFLVGDIRPAVKA